MTSIGSTRTTLATATRTACGPQDIKNYAELLKEFDAQLDTLSKQTHQHNLLTADTPAGVDKYGVLQLHQDSHYVDWMNVMDYDMHGPWSATGPADFTAPLFASPNHPSPSPSNQCSVNTAVTDYLAAGVPANKIVIGVPFYGHGWTNVPNIHHGLYQSSPNMQPAALGGGTAGYHLLANQPGFATYFDSVTQSDWIYDGTTFWSFDDPRSLALKTQYVKWMQLGGVMYWPLMATTHQARWPPLFTTASILDGLRAGPPRSPVTLQNARLHVSGGR